MKKCASNKSIKQYAPQQKWIEAIGSDQIIWPFPFYVLHAFAKAVNGDYKVYKICKGIEWLPDEFMHIGILAEPGADVALCLIPIPYHMSVENIIQYGDNCGKCDSTDNR